MTYGLSHPHQLDFVRLFDLKLYVHGKQLRSCWEGYQLDESTFFSGTSWVFFHFYFIVRANRIVPDGSSRFVASDLGLSCMLMSHKKDARLLWVNNTRDRQSNKTKHVHGFGLLIFLTV